MINMNILINVLFLSVSLIVFAAYRQGIKDGVSIKEKGSVHTVLSRAKEDKLNKEEIDFINQYNEILNYDFDKAGDLNGKQ